jgi:hypothetical protein
MAENAQQQPPKSTALVQRAVPAETGLVSFEPDSLDRAIELCDRLSKSGLLPPMLVGKPNDVLVLTLTGRDLGLTFMQSLQSISIIEGRPSLSTKLKVALVRRHPLCKYFRLVESTDKIAVWATHREGNEPTQEKFTIQEAIAAELVHKTKSGAPGMYQKWPKQMLRARAASQLCDREYQDVLLNLADDIEFAASEADGGPLTRDPALTREAVNAEFERVEPMPGPVKAAPVAAAAKAAATAKPQAEDAEFKPAPAVPPPEDPALALDAKVDYLAALLPKANEQELEGMLKDITALPESHQSKLRGPYKARKVELRAEAAKAAVMAEAEENERKEKEAQQAQAAAAAQEE